MKNENQSGHTQTPGPWFAIKNSAGYWDISDEDRMCALSVGGGMMSFNEANANLIAAAPDLLAACVKVDEAFNKGRFDQFGRFRPTKAEGEALWFAVSEALRKARGQSCPA